jgi:hypothetical protein
MQKIIKNALPFFFEVEWFFSFHENKTKQRNQIVNFVQINLRI